MSKTKTNIINSHILSRNIKKNTGKKNGAFTGYHSRMKTQSCLRMSACCLRVKLQWHMLQDTTKKAEYSGPMAMRRPGQPLRTAKKRFQPEFREAG